MIEDILELVGIYVFLEEKIDIFRSSTSSEHLHNLVEPLQVDAVNYGLDFLQNSLVGASKNSSDAEALGN